MCLLCVLLGMGWNFQGLARSVGSGDTSPGIALYNRRMCLRMSSIKLMIDIPIVRNATSPSVDEQKQEQVEHNSTSENSQDFLKCHGEGFRHF